MKAGYSRAVISENTNELMRAGMSRRLALYHSLSDARKSYFKRFPNGALPRGLAFPKTYLTREFYEENGEPLKTNPSDREIAQAKKLGESFSGHKQHIIGKVRVPDKGGARVAIGPVIGIIYSAKRDGKTENYLHRFAKKARPLLTTSPDGSTLELLGGAFRFTDRGIVDSRVKMRRT